MNFLSKLFKGYESTIYNNAQDQLDAMNRWNVEWQKHKSGDRFHIIKKRGKFTFDEFCKITRDIKEMLNGEYTYEGIELYPMKGAGTTWACKAHTSSARKEKPITVWEWGKYYGVEVRMHFPKSEDERENWTTNYIWITTDDYGERISFSWALPRKWGDKIIEKYFVEGKGYSLGDGFIR